MEFANAEKCMLETIVRKSVSFIFIDFLFSKCIWILFVFTFHFHARIGGSWYWPSMAERQV